MLRRFAAYIFLAVGLTFTLPASTQAASFTAESFMSVPRYSAAPIGSGREPVSFIYIGSEDQIIRLFVDNGWSGADPISASSLARAYRAAQTGAPYPTAPFSPAFIDGQVQDLSFQLPTPANTIAERHHTRIWLTDTVIDGHQVWVGTASLDVSIATVGRAILPVHHIDPDLPTEREFILSNLGLSGAPYVMLNAAGEGSNTFGDRYTHDGLAAIVDLTDRPTTPAAPITSTSNYYHSNTSQSVSSHQSQSISVRVRNYFDRATTYFYSHYQN